MNSHSTIIINKTSQLLIDKDGGAWHQHNRESRTLLYRVELKQFVAAFEACLNGNGLMKAIYDSKSVEDGVEKHVTATVECVGNKVYILYTPDALTDNNYLLLGLMEEDALRFLEGYAKYKSCVEKEAV